MLFEFAGCISNGKVANRFGMKCCEMVDDSDRISNILITFLWRSGFFCGFGVNVQDFPIMVQTDSSRVSCVLCLVLFVKVKFCVTLSVSYTHLTLPTKRIV